MVLTRSREWQLAAGAAVVLVALRSVVPLTWQQLDFDADQAIVGLMAKHLAEGRDFPLFFYGQNYMLGVQAWMAVPFIWLWGATVTAIRMPLLLINLAMAASFVTVLVRHQVRPAFAFVAALPVIVTTPAVSAGLYETLGASVEPILYVLILWALRRKLVPFGIVFCIGVLHREFTVFALPAIAVALWIEGDVPSWRDVARGAAACVGTWVAIDLLKLAIGSGSLAQQAETIGSWISLDGYLIRLESAIARGVPALFGGRAMRLFTFSIRSTLTTGWVVAGSALFAALAVCLVGVIRVAADPVRRPSLRRSAFSAYLAVIALGTLAAYGLNDGIDPDAAPVIRYLLFLLLLPIALLGAFFQLEAAARWRRLVVAAMAVWAAFTLTDNVRLFHEYRTAAPPDEFQMLADHLVAHGIQYGRAQYWDAYVVNFLSQEQVILASTTFIRVESYQRIVEEHGDRAVSIERTPCTSGPVFMSWCIADPLGRIK